MRNAFEAKWFVGEKYHRAEFDTAAEAIAAIEANGKGSITKFYVSANLPGCLPAEVYRSSGLWNFEDGKWMSVSIFGGPGPSKWEERPE
jgi:hypothetical protein